MESLPSHMGCSTGWKPTLSNPARWWVARASRAKRKVEWQIRCKTPDPESVCLELKAHNVFMSNAQG
jgi:hypothetical protein